MARKRILVVDPDLASAQDIARSLEELGYEVQGIVPSGRDGLERSEQFQPDLVLMDVGILSEPDDVQAAAEIYDCLGIPLVYLVEEGNNGSLQHAYSAHAFGFVFRPCTHLQLECAVETALRRHDIEAELRQRETRYRTTAELTSDILFALRVEPEGSLALEYLSGAVQSVTGYAPEEIGERSWTDLIHPDDRSHVLSIAHQVLSGQVKVSEHRIVTKGGDVRWTCSYAKPVWDEGEQRVVRIIGAAQDISDCMCEEKALREQRDHLGALVEERTAELIQANARLQCEMAERVEAEEALRESEARYRAICDVISDYVYGVRVEPDGTAVPEWSSKAFTAVTGISIEDITSAGGWGHFVHPDDRPAFQHHQRVLRSGQSDVAEYRILTRAGGTRWLRNYAQPVWDAEQDRVVRIYGAAQDITARKEAEEQLRFQAQLLDSVRESIIATDLEGRVTYWGRGAEELYGFRPEEVIGQTVTFIVEPDQEEAERERIRQVIGTGSWRGRYLQRRKDGSAFWADTSISLVTDADGKPYGLVGIDRDITEQVQSEEAVRESEEKYRTLVETSTDAIFVETFDGQVLDCNTRAGEMHGYTKEELLGSNALDLIAEESRGVLPELLERERATGSIHAQLLHRGKDGQVFPVEVNTRIAAIGGEERAIVFVRDITNQVRAADELRHSAERLKALWEIDQAILAAESPEEIALSALEHIGGMLPCRQASIAELSQETSKALILATYTDGQVRPGTSQRIPVERLGWDVKKLAQGEAQIVDRASSPPGLAATAGASQDAVVESVVVLPLLAQGALAGCLQLEWSDSGACTREQLTVAQEIADVLAIALQQAQLDAKVRYYAADLERRVAERTRELSTLYEVTAVASRSLELQTVLEQSLERTLGTLDCKGGVIQVLDPGKEGISLAAHRNLPQGHLAALQSSLSQPSLAGWVLEHDETLIVYDIASDYRAFRGTGVQGTHSYVGVPMRSGGQVIGVLSVFGETEQSFTPEDLALLASVADHVAVAVENARLRQRAERAAVLEERERLARELHDAVTQSLYSLTLFTEAARERARHGDLVQMKEHLSHIDATAHQALKEMRLMLYELRPTSPSRSGMVDALRRRLAAVEGRAFINTRVVTNTLAPLPSPLEEELYRVAQEALNNALRHAAATSVTVRLEAEDGELVLEIVDDGRGFDLESASKGGGMGLQNMRQRVEDLGGTLTISSVPGHGTTVRVSVGLGKRGEVP